MYIDGMRGLGWDAFHASSVAALSLQNLSLSQVNLRLCEEVFEYKSLDPWKPACHFLHEPHFSVEPDSSHPFILAGPVRSRAMHVGFQSDGCSTAIMLLMRGNDNI